MRPHLQWYVPFPLAGDMSRFRHRQSWMDGGWVKQTKLVSNVMKDNFLETMENISSPVGIWLLDGFSRLGRVCLQNSGVNVTDSK
jgi:hypothetical protein